MARFSRSCDCGGARFRRGHVIAIRRARVIDRSARRMLGGRAGRRGVSAVTGRRAAARTRRPHLRERRPLSPVPAAIEARRLAKRFGATIAVDAISFAIAAGSVTGLLGGNGAGKTTTIGMIMGLIVPTAGAVSVLGVDMASDRYRVLGADEFREPLRRHAASPHRAPEPAACSAASTASPTSSGASTNSPTSLALGAFLDRPAGSLSAGQKTRVALAKALINEPERSAARRADRLARPRHRGLGARPARGVPAPRAARRSCSPRTTWARSSACASRVLMLKQGRIVDDGSPEELDRALRPRQSRRSVPRRRARRRVAGADGMSRARTPAFRPRASARW